MSLISLHSPVSLQPTQRPRVNDAHPLARDLVFAAVPVPGGYWDASPYANHALQRTGNANAALNVAGGSGYAFTTSDHFTTLGTSSTPVLSTANGFSMALWVNFSTGTPTSYGAVFGRNGTTGATHAGGDWNVSHRDSERHLVLTRSGAELAASTTAVSGGLWYLWHLSVSAAGAFQWWLSGPGAEDTITRGSGTGCPIRTGAGVLHINAALTGSARSNSQVGRVYLWNRESTIADARLLYRDEWGLFAPQERRIWVPVSAGGGATLTPSLITNSQTFYAPTVTPGAVTLAPSLVTNTQTFYAATVSTSNTLQPSLLTDDQTFYAPTVSVGAVTLAPSLVTNSQTFYGATVTQGSQDLQPSLLTNNQTFYSATVTPGAVTLAPSLFTNSPTIYGPSVANIYSLTPGLYSNSSSFYGPTVAPGVVTLAPALFTNSQTFYTPTVADPGATIIPTVPPYIVVHFWRRTA